jgi:hypothetical protein
MQTLDAKPDIVRSGDSLSSIARQFGFSNWKDIYYSPTNAAFRAHRPDPNKTGVGDRLMIPPTPQVVRQVMTERLNKLMQLRLDTDALYQQIEREMDENVRRYENVAGTTDAVATVATVLTSLGFMVVKGMAAMKLTGSALKTANTELAKDAVKLPMEPLKDPALKFAAEKIGANEGIAWAVGKTTIESWLNINSPSWWAGVIGNLRGGKSWSQAVTSDPKEALQAARDQVDKQRQDTLNKIDQKIRDTRALMTGVTSGGLLSLYDKAMPKYA